MHLFSPALLFFFGHSEGCLWSLLPYYWMIKLHRKGFCKFFSSALNIRTIRRPLRDNLQEFPLHAVYNTLCRFHLIPAALWLLPLHRIQSKQNQERFAGNLFRPFLLVDLTTLGVQKVYSAQKYIQGLFRFIFKVLIIIELRNHFFTDSYSTC